MAGSATADRHSDTEHKGFALTKDEQADPTEEEPARVAGPQPEQQRVGPLPWWRTRRGRFVLACLFGGLSAGFGVALTATSGWLIVRAWQQPVILTLLVAIVGVRAFGLGRPVFRYAERVASHDVVLADLVRRRTETYRRLIPLTPARLGRRRRADLLTAVVHDLDDDVNATSRVWVPLAGALIASGVAVAILGLILPPAAFVLALATIIIAVTGLGVLALERPAHRREVRARGTLRQSITVLTTQTDAIRAVHSAGTPPPLSAMARQQQGQARAAGTSAAIRAGAAAVSWLVVAGSILVIAAQAAAAYTSGGLSPPVAAMVALTPIALADVWNTIPESFGQAARAQAARARLAAVLEQEPAVTDPGPQAGAGEQPGPRATTTGAETAGVDVQVDQISARWAGQGEVDLQPLDLDARPGAHVVLTGPNGAGKSTALAVLARHLDPLSGQYRQGGRSVFAMSLEEARARIAIVDDEPHVFNGTVRANLALARPGATSFQMVTALQAVGLGPWLSGLSGGLDAHLQGLSGGERTRLSLARAFLSGRPVLLLDEPTAHLDTSTADAVLEAIATECAARTVVMVSHEHSWRLDPHAWERVEIHPDRRATAMRGQELAASPST